MLATRSAYGTALVKLAKSNPRVIALDGDMKNSTFSEQLMKYNKDNYIECFIAEQNLVGVATGAACRDRTVAFVSTFAAFLTRAFDQVILLLDRLPKFLNIYMFSDSYGCYFSIQHQLLWFSLWCLNW